MLCRLLVGAAFLRQHLAGLFACAPIFCRSRESLWENDLGFGHPLAEELHDLLGQFFGWDLQSSLDSAQIPSVDAERGGYLLKR